MKILLLIIFLSILQSGCANISTDAQIRANGNGMVSNIKSNQTNTNTKVNTLDISTVDFKNFSFPDFSGGPVPKTITLKNGTTDSRNGFPQYTLRKTYFFDLTGDVENEAVTHIIVDGCQIDCESNNFYIHTADGNQPKLLWKIATGGDLLGGLKTASFKVNEIVLETFGECTIENSVIKPKIDPKKKPVPKTGLYTRFVFTRGENGFIQTGSDILPLPINTNIAEYRPQISFGEQ
jgi:hypothetical protein